MYVDIFLTNSEPPIWVVELWNTYVQTIFGSSFHCKLSVQTICLSNYMSALNTVKLLFRTEFKFQVLKDFNYRNVIIGPSCKETQALLENIGFDPNCPFVVIKLPTTNVIKEIITMCIIRF